MTELIRALGQLLEAVGRVHQRSSFAMELGELSNVVIRSLERTWPAYRNAEIAEREFMDEMVHFSVRYANAYARDHANFARARAEATDPGEDPLHSHAHELLDAGESALYS